MQHGEHDYLILDLSKVYLLIVEVYAPLVVVYREPAVLRPAGRCVRRAGAYVPQCNAYTSQQLGCAKRLGDIVVCAEIQRFNLVPLAVPGGKDDNRHLRPLTDVFDYIYAIHIRQAEIQQHHIRAVRGYRRQGLTACADLHNTVIVCVQYGGQEMDDSLVILYHQYDGKILHTANLH